MSEFITVLTGGIIAFVVTNLDDIIILLLFFSQMDANFRRRHIIFGQYLGFAVLILASLPGFFGGLVVPREWIGLLGVLPIAIGLKQLFKREDENDEVQMVNLNFEPSSSRNRAASFLLSVLSPQTYKVAAVTIANGGDNISIYIPLFAGSNVTNLITIIGTFFAMVGIWCGIAYLLTRQPKIARVLNRYGKPIVPFVLIALGLFIMYERGTFSLFR